MEFNPVDIINNFEKILIPSLNNLDAEVKELKRDVSQLKETVSRLQENQLAIRDRLSKMEGKYASIENVMILLNQLNQILLDLTKNHLNKKNQKG